jgi:hypothetical protein
MGCMQFYELRLNVQDMQHLRWVLSNEAEMQQSFMDMPPSEGQSPDEALEDWVIARDFKCHALRLIQSIDNVCPEAKQEPTEEAKETA